MALSLNKWSGHSFFTKSVQQFDHSSTESLLYLAWSFLPWSSYLPPPLFITLIVIHIHPSPCSRQFVGVGWLCGTQIWRKLTSDAFLFSGVTMITAPGSWHHYIAVQTSSIPCARSLLNRETSFSGSTTLSHVVPLIPPWVHKQERHKRCQGSWHCPWTFTASHSLLKEGRLRGERVTSPALFLSGP